MPMHDWSRVGPWVFQAFRHSWVSALNSAMNRGVLPDTHYAVAEPTPGGFDVDDPTARKSSVTGVFTADHRRVARIDIVSPGNKASRASATTYVEAVRRELDAGVHLLLIDLLPSPAWQPGGLHAAVWDGSGGGSTQCVAPVGRPPALISYQAGPLPAAYVEPVGVGQPLAEMPAFLEFDRYVPVPLEATYQAAWDGLPRPWQAAVAAASASAAG